jgi:hypothetical protein
MAVLLAQLELMEVREFQTHLRQQAYLPLVLGAEVAARELLFLEVMEAQEDSQQVVEEVEAQLKLEQTLVLAESEAQDLQ